MFEASLHGAAVDAFTHAQIHAMNIYCIVHHAFVEAVFLDDASAALHKVGGVGLRGEIAALAFGQANVNVVEVDVGAALCHHAHAFGVVNLYVFERGAGVGFKEDARVRAMVASQSHAGAGHHSLVLPVWRNHLVARFLAVAQVDVHVAGLRHYVAGVAIECYASVVLGIPFKSESVECAFFVNIPSHLVGRLEGDAIGSVAHHFHLCNLWVVEVDVQALHAHVGASQNAQWQHAARAQQCASAAVEGEVLPIFKGYSHGVVHHLVVVGDVVFVHRRLG